MKPGFALTLSFDGISLLHRAAGGWRTIGDVTLDNSDLGAALADLREKASRLSPKDQSCKLIIPNDQIRYLTIETGGATDSQRTERVLTALENATPYTVAELAYDISVEGDMTHVAAVARETLAEAEAFAVEHAFHPVCFVAIPGDNLFLGEPYFGPTSHAAAHLGDERVDPEGVAVVIVGMADIPDAPQPKPAPEPEPEPAEAIAGFASRRRKPSTPKQVSVVDPTIEPDEAPAVPAAAEQVVADQKEPQPAAPILGPTTPPSPPPAPSRALAGATRDESGSDPAVVAAPVIETKPRPAVVQIPSPALRAAAAPDIAETPTKVPSAVANPVAPPKSNFLSRRKNSKAAAVALASPDQGPAESLIPVAGGPESLDETQRMTVFGARTDSGVGGKPRYLGLILTAVLLLFLAGIAAWASLFMDTKLSRWLFLSPGESELAEEPEPIGESPFTTGPEPDLQIASVPVAPEADPMTLPQVQDDAAAMAPQASSDTGLTDTGLTDTDAAVLDALREPIQVTEPPPVDDQTLYAATGIWQTSPQPLETPAVIGLDDMYVASIDRTDLSQDAVALPSVESLRTDEPLQAVGSPVAAGTEFALDSRGLVIPTAAGAVSPDGVTVYLGAPPKRPPPTPARLDPEAEQNEVQLYLASLRPLGRPDDLVEQSERANLQGRTRSELGRVRPLLRPDIPVVVEPEVVETPGTALAVAESPVPLRRPADLDTETERAAASVASLGSAAGIANAQAAASIAPRTVKPSTPSTASVARQATLDNAINLRKINLIGVYGTSANRRALVRLPSGRYKKIKVGDTIDGGRVLAISDSELRYQKSGRSLTLKIPSS